MSASAGASIQERQSPALERESHGEVRLRCGDRRLRLRWKRRRPPCQRRFDCIFQWCVRFTADDRCQPIVAQHPQLTIELVLTNRVQDLLRREADIAVRMTPPKQGALVAKRVALVTLGLHAHHSYLAQRGTPRNTAELERHSLIGFDAETPFIRAARKALPMWTREVFALRTDSDLAQLALIRSGCGIGVCQVAIAKRDPSLVRVMPRQFEFKLETWVTMHEDLRNSPRCKVTFDALVRGLTGRVRQG
jgi:DNA-binding transcriptional LysR family regulator